ncbi:Cytochrome oxidase assembly protein ShyY1 [Marinobacter sp. LV10R510-11A]|uniref:SURF1 family protein n=1 Tax=Marinobacter sp. LV10R510-11A TaxID=1415568 RepID=UPI000BB949DB|nr:SURF1 family protein [Marinobacter sp. LV10R510-11A]SOB77281.1 Cytochrome oxidase assembly protein ShyY1 [Marinobacter sp. LV10R510-11A]
MTDVKKNPRQWHVDWRLMVFTGVFFPLLIALGIWQLSRAEEKQVVLDQWQQEAQDLNWPEQVASGLDIGRPVTVTGLFGDRSWLLDNRTRDGFAGYEVLTELHPLQGPPVIVNRGWIAAPRTRNELPNVNPPEGVFSLTGRIGQYPEPPVLSNKSAPAEGWPRRVQMLSRSVAVAEIAELPGAVIRLQDSEQPGAYRADWKPDLMGPQTHYGYATQWFALAVVLSILSVVASYRKTGSNNDDDNG